MMRYKLEVAVDANLNDILAFLERDNQFISSKYFSDTPKGFDMTVNFYSRRENNALSICTKIYTTRKGKIYPRCYEDAPDGEGNEAIRFEVLRLTDIRSQVICFYPQDNIDIQLMFWERLARFGVAFGGGFANEAQNMLEELKEQLGKEQVWQEISDTVIGNTISSFVLLPKQNLQKRLIRKTEERMESNINEEILVKLYSAFSKGEHLVGINELSDALKKSTEELFETLSGLISNDLISGVTNDSYRILPKGINYVENKKLASEALIFENSKIQEKILSELETSHKKYGGSQSVHLQEIISILKRDQYVIVNNIELLEKLGFIFEKTSSDYKITDIGLQKLQKIRQAEEMSSEFKEILILEPHVRGRRFQEFFGKIVSREDWKQENSVKTISEEIDLILERDDKFFLVECKWEQKPVESEVIRNFYGKLDAREGVEGIIVSMSGFAKGAIEEVKSRVGKKIIVLFGSEDVNSCIQDMKFTELFREKRRQLITKKIVQIDNLEYKTD